MRLAQQLLLTHQSIAIVLGSHWGGKSGDITLPLQLALLDIPTPEHVILNLIKLIALNELLPFV